jgi:hypothetical protein
MEFFVALFMSLDGEIFLVVVRILALMCLLAFLRGLLENVAFSAWFFDGENVVVCVVNVVTKTRDFHSKKIRHEIQLYFWSDQQSETRGLVGLVRRPRRGKIEGPLG